MSKFWENLTDREEALDAILTGYKGEVNDMPVYEDVMKHLKHKGSILDFGCGAGRNLKYLINHYNNVYGYDYPNMLKLVSRETKDAENLILLNSLDSVLLRTYDEILFSLVLQHIHPNELRAILSEITSHASRFIIHSRTWVDFTEEPIMPILEEFFRIDMVEYKKDPNSEKNDHFIGIFLPRS
jgi:SAM-dependent methyltransferase